MAPDPDDLEGQGHDARALVRDALFLDPKTRNALAEAWLGYLDGEPMAALPPMPRHWAEVCAAVEPLLKPWRSMTRGDPAAASRVASALVERLHKADAFLRRSPENPRNAPLAQQLAQLESVEGPAHNLGQIFDGLVELSPVGAFERLRQSYLSGSDEPLRVEALRRELLARWNAMQGPRVERWEGEVLRSAISELSIELARKKEAMEVLTRALGVGLGSLGVGADWSAGFWQEGLWEKVEHLAAQAEANPSIRKLAAALGRVDAAENKLAEQQVVEPVDKERALSGGRSEIKGLTLGDDLSRLTGCDLGLLAVPELEVLFYARYAEKRLHCWEIDGKVLYEEQERVRRLRPSTSKQKRGPIVLCIDTSGSMSGAPETVAKTLALAVLRIALAQRRECLLIAFGSTLDIKTVALHGLPESLPGLLTFLSGAFRGGTDPGPALMHAAKEIDGDYDCADLLVITDGVFSLDEHLRQELLSLKERMDFLCHVLLVGNFASVPAEGFADVTWRWSTGEDFELGAARMLKKLRRTSSGR